MIRRVLIYLARRSHTVTTQYRIAVLVGLLTCFGWKGSLAIYMKIGKAIVAEQEKQKRKQVKKSSEPPPFVNERPTSEI
jgi:hypothetical protein